MDGVDSALSPASVGTLASRSTTMAALEPVSLRKALAKYARVNCGLPLLAQGVHRPNTVMPDVDKYGNPSAAYLFAAHVAKVEVDCATGQVRVVENWAVHDSGTIINPATARSQVLGGIAQRVGWALMEDVVSRDGRVANPNFLDYRIPRAVAETATPLLVHDATAVIQGRVEAVPSR
jgi:CO/xanthine dehydrogenase Mo-binding subunit